ncbi:uncharacterized protein LOC114188505 [Vigna unguiculata]|uniref:uncharacterized protein LOC114188505 n=1 Tax=Vigna unguiculata TaxID=3917 RepID=UPI001016AECB|nr:uncharacterized protein LOC114188505 [Vigna unguiculata]
MSTHREWMYNRLLPGREAYTNEFLSGLEEFMAFACRQPNLSEGKIRCPCKECKNENGASLHTGGSIPHRLHWKRMKEEKGANPSLTEFYFRTHRRKKDQSWVGLHAKLAFDKFEQRKRELTSQGNMENASDGEQSIHENPSDWDIWIDSVGKKKGRVFGLGSVGRMFISTSSQQLHFEEVDTLRSQIQALNESLQRQEEEKVEMKRELQKQRKDKIEMRKELTETKNQVIALMQHLGYVASSSHQSLSSPHTNEDEDDNDSDHTEDGY